MTETLDVTLPSGRLHVERTGPVDAERTAICVHGLTANVRSWDGLREELAVAGVQTIAMDLRGRGHSAETGPGSYGLARHAEDVVALADHFGLAGWHQVGWSMGALISLELARLAGERLESATLIDAAGGMDDAVLELVRAGTARLDATVATESDYFAAVQASGVFTPWGPFWERYFRWELAPVVGGLSPTTSRAACLEDMNAATDDLTLLWPHVTMPALLVWAAVPMGGGLLVPEPVRDRFLVEVPGSRLVVAEQNHYGVMTDAAVRAAVVAHVMGS